MKGGDYIMPPTMQERGIRPAAAESRFKLKEVIKSSGTGTENFKPGSITVFEESASRLDRTGLSKTVNRTPMFSNPSGN